MNVLSKIKFFAPAMLFSAVSGCAVIDLSTPGQATVLGFADVKSQPMSDKDAGGETLTIVSFGLSLMLTSQEYALTLGHQRVSVATLKDNAFIKGSLILE